MNLEKKKTRVGIDGEINNNKKLQNKKLENIRKVTIDKQIEARVARELKRGGTVEGTKAIEKGVRKAGDVTDKEFNKQEKGIKKEVFDPAKKRESELDKRSNIAKADAKKLEQAISKMDTRPAKDNIKVAASASEDDGKFLKNKEKDQKQSRSSGEKETKKQKSILDHNRISF